MTRDAPKRLPSDVSPPAASAIAARIALAIGALAGLAAIGSACSGTSTATLSLTLGGETDTMTRDPAPTTLLVETVDADGTTTTLARAALPADTIDLGTSSATTVTSIHVTGLDAAGTARVRGASVLVELGVLTSVDLSVFVQRTGEMARMPSPLSDARAHPVLGSVVGRFVLVAGGDDASQGATTAIYDLASWASLGSPPTLPRAPRTMATSGTRVLLVDDAGASWFDLSDSTSGDATAPAGGAFGEVSGGDVIAAPDGSTYVVGATRTTGAPTARVLRIDPSGVLSFAALGAARLGAAAAWVDGRGVVVVGGAASGAGVEVLGPGAAAADALPYPPDPTTGAGAAAVDGAHVVVLGGTGAADVRTIDLGCSTACAPAPGAALPTALPSVRAFALGGTAVLAVGDDATGATHAVHVDGADVADVPLKIARSGARALRLPTGAIAVVGGVTTIESYVP